MTILSARDAATVVAACDFTRELLDTLGPVLLAGHTVFHRKDDGSVVSDIDHTVQQAFVTGITDTFVGHEVLSEEGLCDSGTSRWRWVIDPLDGTSNFTSGLPFWCVSVALTLNGMPVMAVVDAPALNMRVWATAGGGTFARINGNTSPVTVREPVGLFDESQRQIPLMLTPTTLVTARKAKVSLRQRVLGATALDLAYVALGVAAGSVAVVPHVWDVAAGVLLVREAGGVVLSVPDVLLPVLPDTAYVNRQAAVVAAPSFVAATTLAKTVLADTVHNTLSRLWADG